MKECSTNRVLVTCIRGFERDAASEAWWALTTLIKQKTIDANLTKVPGLIYVTVAIDPTDIMAGLLEFLTKNRDEIRFCAKFIPIQDWGPTDLALICRKINMMSSVISKEDSWCIQIQKRHTSLKRADIIKQVADNVPYGKGVSLDFPNKIIRIEIIGRETGLAIHGPDQIISMEKLRRISDIREETYV